MESTFSNLKDLNKFLDNLLSTFHFTWLLSKRIPFSHVQGNFAVELTFYFFTSQCAACFSEVFFKEKKKKCNKNDTENRIMHRKSKKESKSMQTISSACIPR
uniref:Uncharacterized protein n=1 Tax=Micrurus lemniscatus lemniscatus TaxID=129467 RepID=A0A2D4I277_MICLE